MKTMGFVRAISVDAEEGRAVVEFEAKIDQCHSGNVVQGGYVAGWIDNAMATAVLFKTDFQNLVMSLEIKVSYYRAANPGTVIAEGWIERIGKKTAFAEGLLRTRDGEIIAKASSTIALLPQRKQG
ncbi:MAG TPA: PaaI family thioesterase [Myxococcales bacterium]|nr:PaaI family thioesterase [Myxococcales bacterium]HIK86479.1 PaaI family thioesterase [Myxococcales bacterium]